MMKPLKDRNTHTPILLTTILEYLSIVDDGIYLDATIGNAGHSLEIIKRINNGFLYAVDVDKVAIELSNTRLKDYKNYKIIESNYDDAMDYFKSMNLKFDGILFDLGISSMQLDSEDRGFSYRFEEAILDMRQSDLNSLLAKDILNQYRESEIADILYNYGELGDSRVIAKAIVSYRKRKKFEIVRDLLDAIELVIPKGLAKPRKKIFQALRIAVNDELNVLRSSVSKAITLLNKDGVIAVLTFHSLEDRIVKNIFLEAEETGSYKRINKKVITPTEAEIRDNKRAHSAKLRVLKRIV